MLEYSGMAHLNPLRLLLLCMFGFLFWRRDLSHLLSSTKPHVIWLKVDLKNADLFTWTYWVEYCNNYRSFFLFLFIPSYLLLRPSLVSISIFSLPVFTSIFSLFGIFDLSNSLYKSSLTSVWLDGVDANCGCCMELRNGGATTVNNFSSVFLFF